MLRKSLCISILVTAVFTAMPFCTKEKQKIIIKGSTTVEPITRIAAEKYSAKRDQEIIIESNGSHKGITALIEGQCDIVDSSVKISPDEISMAEERGVKIREFVIAYDLIVPIVHPSNPVNNLSLKHLRDIFSCEADNWKQFGGRDDKIHVVIRDNFSGTHDVWNEIIVCKDSDIKKNIVQPSNSGVLAYVAQNPGAIGYLSLGFLNRDIKPVAVNSIAPSSDIKKAGRFPIKRKLYLYVDDNRFTQSAKSFIVFLLSKEGQEIIRGAGYIPVTMAYMD